MKSPSTKIFDAGSIAAVIAENGIAPMMFDCCCIAKVRFAMTSLRRFAWARLDEMWPTKAIMIPMMVTATMTSMSDKPFRELIVTSPKLDHSPLRHLHTARVAVRREVDDHRVRGRETVRIDLDPGRRRVIADVVALQIVARAERGLAIGDRLTAIRYQHLHLRGVAPNAHGPANAARHREGHAQIVGDTDGRFGHSLVGQIRAEFAHRQTRHHRHDHQHGEELDDGKTAAIVKHETLVYGAARQEW